MLSLWNTYNVKDTQVTENITCILLSFFLLSLCFLAVFLYYCTNIIDMLLIFLGGKMSLRGGAHGYVLVHGGPPSCCHSHASSLPLPNTGNSSSQKNLPSVLHRDQFSLPQRPCVGIIDWGVGPASQNSPKGPQYCWSKTSLVRK